MMFNNGAKLMQKATPLATTDRAEYDKQKAVADEDFKKASEYLEQALQISPEREAAKKVLDQVKAVL
jgi:pilus assembly protein Flp/PilA